MANRFVRMDVGSDSNGGTSRSDAFLTINAAVLVSSSGDTIYVSGTSTLGHGAVNNTISNLTITQDPDGDQAIWIGGNTIANSGWTETSGGSGVWDKTITASLSIDAICYNYLASTNSRGSHYGTLKLEASRAAVIAAGSGTQGNWFYVGGTGAVTGYFGGDNPNTSGKVIHYVSRRDVSAIKLIGTGNTVSGIWFKMWQQSGQGAGGVWLEDATGTGSITSCKAWDSGPHAFIVYGALAGIANVTISGCAAYGGRNDGSCFTAYQTNASGTLSNVVISSCHVERHNHLNLDQKAITDDASISLTAFYCHGDAGTPIAGVQYVGCTTYDLNPSRATTAGTQFCNAPPISGGSSAAPASLTVPTGYKVRAIRCVIRNASRAQQSNHITFEQCEIHLDQQGLSGLSTYGGNGALSAVTAGTKCYYECCLIKLDSTPQVINDSIIGIHTASVGTAEQYFNTCTIVDAATSNNGKTGTSRTMMTFGTNQAGTTCTFLRCIFTPVSGTPDSIQFSYSDGETALTRTNCVYGGPFDAYGLGSILFADPLTSDATGINPATNPLASDYRVSTSATTVYGVKATTTTIPPSAGLDVGYQGYYGAYQNQGATGSRGGGGRTSSPSRVARV